MKGVIFTEFMDFIDEAFGWEVSEEMIEGAELAHDAAYTAVGTYPHEEILALITSLSRITDTPPSVLVHAYGKHLFGVLAASHAQVVGRPRDTIELLRGIEGHIHVEVRKLYPDAELPTFDVADEGGALVLRYSSARPFATLALGLIEGCIEHFGDPMSVEVEHTPGAAGREARFTVRRVE